MGSQGTGNTDLDAWRCHDANAILGSTWLRSVAAWAVLGVMGLVAAFGPVVLLTALGVGLLGGVLWAGDRLISRARFGRPAALGLEALAAVIVVPGAFFAASTGISVAFYVMSRPSGTPDAVTVLLYTGVLAVELAWLSVRSLVRHRSGAEISPFERDVEPGAALARIAQLRNARGPLLSPASALAAARWAERRFETWNADSSSEQITPTMREALRDLRAAQREPGVPGTRRMQWLVIATIVAACWWGWSRYHAADTYGPDAQSVAVTASLAVAVVLAHSGLLMCMTVLGLKERARQQLRWLIRAGDLQRTQEENRRAREVEQANASALTGIVSELSLVRLELERLRTAQAPSPVTRQVRAVGYSLTFVARAFARTKNGPTRP